MRLSSRWRRDRPFVGLLGLCVFFGPMTGCVAEMTHSRGANGGRVESPSAPVILSPDARVRARSGKKRLLV